MLLLNVDGIPMEMQKKKQWVVFKVGQEGKVPYVATDLDKKASISDPSTWSSFKDAAPVVYGGFNPDTALGYALTPKDKLIFIDVDCHLEGCSSDEEKEKRQKDFNRVSKEVSRFDTYMEQSLNGGIHLLAKGKVLDDVKTGASTIAPVEMYFQKRFIIMTGHKLNDLDISDDERTIGAIHNFQKFYFAPKSDANTSAGDKKYIPPIQDPIRSDDEVIKIALRNEEFNLLWNNQWEQVINREGNQKYSSQHYADMGLMRKLIFFTGNCPAQAERLFRSSPCYQAYGKDGKWSKYDKDIKKDLETTSSTCLAVYDPNYKATKTKPPEPAPANTDQPLVALPLMPPLDVPPLVLGVERLCPNGKPDFDAVYQAVTTTDENLKIFRNRELNNLLKEYIERYYDQKDGIDYLPKLFIEHPNINGCTAIVKKVHGDAFKYSNKFKGYYLWDGKRYKEFEDKELLIHPITKALGNVEHSVFLWTITEVAKAEDEITYNNDESEGGKTKKKGPSTKDIKEADAVKKFKNCTKYAEKAASVLLKYKGLDFTNDLCLYYESPYINMQNGVLDLNTRELLDHDAKYNQIKITNCNFDSTAQCPEFEAMMQRLLPDDALRKEFQKAVGLCLVKKEVPAKKVLFLLIGPKDTGKTTVINTILDVLGEYGCSVDNSLLMQSGKNKTVGPEMFDLRESLMISTSEASENDKLDNARVKALTGGTEQSIRNNFATSMVKFSMTGLIFIDSNFKPFIPARDTATWDRLRLFPFINPITKKDPDLKEKLKGEKSGIFNWILKGMDMVLEEQEIFETPAMLELKQGYQEEMDTTAQFLKDCVVEEDGIKIRTAMLHTTYKNWCKYNGFIASVREKFYDDICKVYERKKTKGYHYFIDASFTELGELYSTMQEQTPIQFAKAMRTLLEEPDTSLPYNVLRATYFSKTKEWFMTNIKEPPFISDRSGMYYAYSAWCIEHSLVPIKPEDFNAKLRYIYDSKMAVPLSPDGIKEISTKWNS